MNSPTIDNLAKLRLSSLRRFLAGAMNKRISCRLTLSNRSFKVAFDCMFNGKLLAIGWEEGGKEYTQWIPIVARPSNLIKGSEVLYFNCNGYLCRTLYTDGRGFHSRREFKHHYKTQSLSRKERLLYTMPNPTRKYGKKVYRGKLTPYGKRCERFSTQDDSWIRKYLALEVLGDPIRVVAAKQ